ncbi:MAG: methyltransferase domain-containing protein [Actinomycetota bacterium]
MTGYDRQARPGDAFGAALLDYLHGGSGVHVTERDDGQSDTMGAGLYFAEYDEWENIHFATGIDATALDIVSGRVLDVGAGAGRHSLVLQRRGDEPVALDTSPGAIEVCRERGVEQIFLGTTDELAAQDPEPFDAAILLGHNLAILGSAEFSGPFLDSLRSLLKPGGVIVGNCRDPYTTDEPIHLAYHQRNRELGRMPGQIRLRVRFQDIAGGWFDYLFVSPAELAELAAAAGWRVEEATEPNPSYMAVLRPE